MTVFIKYALFNMPRSKITNQEEEIIVTKGKFLIAAVFGFLVFLLVFLPLGNRSEGRSGQNHESQKIFSRKTPNAVRGWASWYGPGFRGKKMANGKRYNQRRVSVAHRSLPLGTKVRIVNLRNQKTITAFVSDRGPYVHGRILDLSYAAAQKLDAVRAGVIPVKIEIKI